MLMGAVCCKWAGCCNLTTQVGPMFASCIGCVELKIVNRSVKILKMEKNYLGTITKYDRRSIQFQEQRVVKGSC